MIELTFYRLIDLIKNNKTFCLRGTKVRLLSREEKAIIFYNTTGNTMSFC